MAFTSKGRDHSSGFLGGVKRSGGAPNGIPRNLLTPVEEEGKEVVVPITAPESIVAVGTFEADIWLIKKQRLNAILDIP